MRLPPYASPDLGSSKAGHSGVGWEGVSSRCSCGNSVSGRGRTSFWVAGTYPWFIWRQTDFLLYDPPFSFLLAAVLWTTRVWVFAHRAPISLARSIVVFSKAL